MKKTKEMKEMVFEKNKNTKEVKKIPDTSGDLRKFINRKRHLEKKIFPGIKIKFGFAC